jgi:putative RecB family exonuclease
MESTHFVSGGAYVPMIALKAKDTLIRSTFRIAGPEHLGFDPEQLGLRLDVLLKTKTPELIRYETTRTQRDRERFVRMVTQVWNGIESGVWFPKQDWHCSQCPYSGACEDW